MVVGIPTEIKQGESRVAITPAGVLPMNLRGKVADESQIIDIIPTIAQLAGIPYECEGQSLLKDLL